MKNVSGSNRVGQNQKAWNIPVYLILIYTVLVCKFKTHGLVGCFRLFIVATDCPSERRPQKTVICYGG